ncbi:glycosyltransferase family 2 protein [Malikia spinosa]|uniref:glycosyltransferase family 2 protein n=1 Tax=Malikia spinosa TaxID=86180 RepID=UPI0027B8CDB2|nr:glycosyltransferase family 2 protein [Malikia spinosa]
MKISIIIPCYNDGHFAIEAIDSCLSQVMEIESSAEIEILFVDDGSTNNSLNLVSDKYRHNNKVIILKKDNGGLSSARNFGILNATGNYIVFLDSDDLLGPSYISSAITSIRKISFKKKLSITFSPFKYFSTDPSQESKVNSKIQYNPPVFVNINIINRLLISIGNCFPVSSCILSKDLIAATGFFDESLKSHEDWDYWIRAIKYCQHISHMENDEKSATLIRVREGMMSDTKKMNSSKIDILNKHADEFPFIIYKLRICWYLILIFRRIYEKTQKKIFRKTRNLTKSIHHLN